LVGYAVARHGMVNSVFRLLDESCSDDLHVKTTI